MKKAELKTVTSEWFDTLIANCKSIIGEKEFNARWALVECYHELGNRILQENDNFEKEKIYGEEITKRVSLSLGKSQRTVQQAIKFAKKFPILSLDVFGKDVSWHQIANKYLPENSESNDDHNKKGKIGTLMTIEGWSLFATRWITEVKQKEPIAQWSSERKEAIKQELLPIVQFYQELDS